MSLEKKAIRVLDRLARGLSGAATARDVGRAVGRELGGLGVRVLDGVVGRLAGHDVRTTTRAIAVERPAALPRPDPEPVAIAPEPVATAPEPATIALEPVATIAPEPATIALEPVTLALEPVSPEPEVAAPEPAPRDSLLPGEIAQLRPARTTDPMPSLPARFGIDRVVLLAGETEWAFCYWETEPGRVAVDAHAELRLVDAEGGLVTRMIVEPLQGRRHVQLPVVGRRYRAELVLIDGSVGGVTLSASRWVEARPSRATT
jgi:hypothetical protein